MMKNRNNRKHRTNKEKWRRKEEKHTRFNTENGWVQKIKTNFVFKKLTTEKFDFFFLEKNRDGDEEKKWEEARKQRDQDQKRESEEKWVKTKSGYATTAMEKKDE